MGLTSITLITCGPFTTFAFYPGTLQMEPPPLFGVSVSKMYAWGRCFAEKQLVPAEVKSMTNKKVVSMFAGMFLTLTLTSTPLFYFL
jgi:hypothetical protein